MGRFHRCLLAAAEATAEAIGGRGEPARGATSLPSRLPAEARRPSDIALKEAEAQPLVELVRRLWEGLAEGMHGGVRERLRQVPRERVLDVLVVRAREDARVRVRNVCHELLLGSR